MKKLVFNVDLDIFEILEKIFILKKIKFENQIDQYDDIDGPFQETIIYETIETKNDIEKIIDLFDLYSVFEEEL